MHALLKKSASRFGTRTRSRLVSHHYCTPHDSLLKRHAVQIFQPIDAETQGFGLTATKALITALYGADGPDARVAGLAQAITEECLRILREPEKSQAKPASMVISALVETTCQSSLHDTRTSVG